MVGAKQFAHKRAKMFVMHPTQYGHPGEIVKTWRERCGLSVQQLADLAQTSRQNIENFERCTVRNPHYLPSLARVMGYASSDELRSLKEPPLDIPAGMGVQAQPMSHFTTSLPTQLQWERVMQKETHLPDEFVTEMPDGALAPRIMPGTAIWFRKSSRAEPRNVVLIEAGGRRWIRRLIETADGPLAQAIDDAFPSFDNFTVVAVMHMRADSSI